MRVFPFGESGVKFGTSMKLEQCHYIRKGKHISIIIPLSPKQYSPSILEAIEKYFTPPI
jgi:hypothetical protein